VRYTAAAGWQPVESVTPETAIHSGLEFDFDVAAAGDGNMMFVYIDKTDSTGSIYDTAYAAASGWSAPQPLPFATPKIAVNPQIIADGLGRFVVVWREGLRIRADRFE